MQDPFYSRVYVGRSPSGLSRLHPRSIWRRHEASCERFGVVWVDSRRASPHKGSPGPTGGSGEDVWTHKGFDTKTILQQYWLRERLSVGRTAQCGENGCGEQLERTAEGTAQWGTVSCAAGFRWAPEHAGAGEAECMIMSRHQRSEQNPSLFSINTWLRASWLNVV